MLKTENVYKELNFTNVKIRYNEKKYRNIKIICFLMMIFIFLISLLIVFQTISKMFLILIVPLLLFGYYIYTNFLNNQYYNFISYIKNVKDIKGEIVDEKPLFTITNIDGDKQTLLLNEFNINNIKYCYNIPLKNSYKLYIIEINIKNFIVYLREDGKYENFV